MLNLENTNESLGDCNMPVAALLPSRAAGVSREHEGSAEGSTPSITDPSDTKIYRHGVDSLYLSYRGALSIDAINMLEEKKKAAQSEDPTEVSAAQISVAGHHFKVKDKGAGSFSFRLKDNAFKIKLSKSANAPTPMAYVEISSELLTLCGLEAAVNDANAVIHALGNVLCEPTISRVDLCVDFSTNFNVEELTSEDYVTKCINFATYERKPSAGLEKPKLTGKAVGYGGDIAMRQYDKTLELQKNARPYLEDMWETAGWDRQKTVHRLEYQIEREALKGMGIDTVSNLLNVQTYLWEYLTTNWLRVVKENPNDTHRDRWPMQPYWEVLTKAYQGEGSFPLSQRFSNRCTPDKGKIIRHIASGLASFMAINGLQDVAGTLQIFKTEADHYFSRASNFEDTLTSYTRKKIAEKCRQYNIPLPEQGRRVADEPVPDPDDYDDLDVL